MPYPRSVLLCLALALALGSPLHALVNGNFETGDLTGWTTTTNTGGGFGPAVTVVNGGTAPGTAGGLNQVYAGNYSCMIFSGSGGSNHSTWARVSQSTVITALTSNLNFQIACVLDGTHVVNPSDDAYTELMVSTTSSVIYQGTYNYSSAPAALVYDGVSNKKHLPWTPINLDLSAYIGSTVTISFSAYDCAPSGHDTTAYLDGFVLVTPTHTRTITQTSTITPTFSHSPTATATPTTTATPSVTMTFSVSPTFSDTPTITCTPTVTPTFSASPTVSDTPSITDTFTHSPTFTDSPTASPTFTVTPTFTITSSVTGTFTRTVTVTETPTPPPLKLRLFPPSPNPSNGAELLWIPYQLTVDADVTIEVWTVAGERTRHLSAGHQSAGVHEQAWDQKNESGSPVASGIFIYRVQAISAKDEKDEGYMKCAVTR